MAGRRGDNDQLSVDFKYVPFIPLKFKLRRLAIKLPAEIAFAEKLPVASLRIKVEAVFAVSIWAVFNREISMVLFFKMAVIFPVV